jgi:tRNA(Arg) A34 adenosine deaminase TadA
MCIVALIHSRVRRVVFAEPNPDEIGGLLTAKIHSERALNHRYEAFQLPLAEVSGLCERREETTQYEESIKKVET